MMQSFKYVTSIEIKKALVSNDVYLFIIVPITALLLSQRIFIQSAFYNLQALLAGCKKQIE